MKLFNRKRKEQPLPILAGGGSVYPQPFSVMNSYTPLNSAGNDLYRSLCEAVPLIDAAIGKLIRLTGGFKVTAADNRYDSLLSEFAYTLPCGSGGSSIYSFIDTYFEQLLKFGTAAGEMLTDENGGVRYVYTARQEDVCLKRNPDNFTQILVCRDDISGAVPVKNQELVLLSTLNPEPGSLKGTSILNGLPFVSSVLLKIFNATGQNWDRVGNVRFAVTYKPGEDINSKAFAKERAEQIAHEWGNAMKSGSVKDFIAVGDVDIKVIGADNQIPDSEIPVRQMLEQIVAKLGIPPFLLGLSWSTTERMAAIETDVLTTELWHYRRILTPVIEKVCKTHLRSFGYNGKIAVEWDEITLQDEVESAQAELLRAQTKSIEKEGNK